MSTTMPMTLSQIAFDAVPFLAQQSPGPRTAWAPVLLLIVIAIGFTVANIALSIFIGPGRSGPGKETTYESGMVPVGDARQRFNVRFYIVAMVFLVFDVEIVFMYPWAAVFAPASQAGAIAGRGGAGDLGPLLLIEMVIFVGILLLAYIYAWGKGVFRWD